MKCCVGALLLCALIAIPSAARGAGDSVPSALTVFQKAQDNWEARRLPPYIEFDVQIRHRDTAGNVTTGNEHVLLRTFDHWCKTREVDSDSPKVSTSMGPSCVGPALSPLGFNIAAQYPNSLQVDPFVSSLRTIASVHAVHYIITPAANETVDGHLCYHLLLKPISDPDYYPLRAIWVDPTTYDVRKLTYAMHQNDWTAAIDYAFRPFGPRATWWIYAIDANWTPPPADTIDLGYVSTLLLTNVSFPAAP